MTKVVKIYLISKVTHNDGSEVKYPDVCHILWDLQKNTRMIKNKTVQKCWEWYNFQSDYNNVFCEYPKDKDVLKRTLSGFVYDELKSESKLNTGNFSTTIKDVCDHFKNNKSEYLKGEKSIVNYKKDQPLDIKSDSINLNYNDNKFFFELSMLNKAAMKEYNVNKFKFECVVEDRSTRSILERCYDGVYKISASKLMYDKKKKMWKLNLSYTFENKVNNKLDDYKILGVDLGVVNPIVASIYGEYGKFEIKGNEIESFRAKTEARRISLKKQGVYCGSGRIGHGRNTRNKPTLNIGDKISRFRDTTNFKYAKSLVDYAIKNKCSVIQIEDLSGVSNQKSEDMRFLKNWSYYDLQMKIINKAAENGIKVVKIDPFCTSRRCSRCGFIDKDNRTSQSNFKCLSCGYEANADYNASQNIAIKDIDKVIKQWCSDNKGANVK